MKNFKRKKINDTSYLLQLVKYIHYNPIEAKCCNKQEEWKYSSYHAIITDSNTSIKKQAVIAWFNDLENFKNIHALEPVELNAFLI